jgi:acetoin utilization deacetylase AcuC-like enzyme
VDETGEGDGEGYTMNIPFPAGSGDAEYLAAIDECIAPALSEFGPDLLLVSAGFDAHRHDPISRMRVSTEGYGVLTQRLRELVDTVDAGLGFLLEGGYGLDTLAESVSMVHEVFDGREPMYPEEDPDDRALAVLEEVRAQGFAGL